MGQNTPKFLGFIMFASGVGMIFSWLTYTKYGMAKRNYRWFLKYGDESMLTDVDACKCENPKINMIFGKYAILSTYNAWFVIPYSQIAWIYVTEAIVNYATKNYSATVYTKDGKKFVLFGVNQDMLADVAKNHIIPNSPDVLIGFDKEKKRRYKQMYNKMFL